MDICDPFSGCADETVGIDMTTASAIAKRDFMPSSVVVVVVVRAARAAVRC
jgi:hypothetical protein